MLLKAEVRIICFELETLLNKLVKLCNCFFQKNNFEQKCKVFYFHKKSQPIFQEAFFRYLTLSTYSLFEGSQKLNGFTKLMAWKPSFSPGSKRVKSNQQTTKKWNKYCNFYILEWSAQLLLCPSSSIKDFAGLHLFVETYCQLHLFFL